MCRLLGYVAPDPTTIEETIGGPALDQFTRLSKLHGDGWGTAWFAPDDPSGRQHTYRSPSPAHSDPTFATEVRSQPSRVRVMHLRWASPGLPVEADNTHPFHVGSTSFAHNGSLLPPRRIEEFLDPEYAATLVGTTDSERYFALFRQEQDRAGGDSLVAVRRTVDLLRSVFPIASLNALILSSDELIVVHANSVEAAPTPEELPTAVPPDHLDAYYLMRWRRTPTGALTFTSSGLLDDGWTPLAEDTVTRIDLTDLSVVTDKIVVGSADAADH